MKILIDTNVILDVVLKRLDYYENSSLVFDAIHKNKFDCYFTATTVTDIYYFTKKYLNHESALELIINLMDFLEVLSVDRNIILLSILSNINDFEDAIQVETAKENNVDLIITRNIKDFKKSPIKVLTPAEFVKLFEL